MQLSVEQIIAKVTIQRQKEKQVQKQQQLLKQISQKPIINQQSNIKHTKPSFKPLVKHQNEGLTLQKKYQNLNQIYKKLKTQLTTELKMDKKHNELIERLTKVIEQNSKLQSELDCLRTKRSVIEYNEKSLNDEENEKRNKSKRYIQKNQKARRSVESMSKSSVCCECAEKIVKQNFNTEAFQGEKLCKNKAQTQISNKMKQLPNPKIIKPHIVVQTNNDLDIQIQQYKKLISQKQSSISKLNFMLQKQTELILSYENQFRQNDQKVTSLSSKTMDKKHQTKESRKFQGTIVKVKRQKRSPAVGDEMQNKALTDRSSYVFHPNYYNFLSPTYVQPYDQKTKKKLEPSQNYDKNPSETIQNKNPGYKNNFNGQHNKFQMEQFPSQKQESQQNQYYYKPEYHSPSSSINETSEFICGGLE